MQLCDTATDIIMQCRTCCWEDKSAVHSPRKPIPPIFTDHRCLCREAEEVWCWGGVVVEETQRARRIFNIPQWRLQLARRSFTPQLQSQRDFDCKRILVHFPTVVKARSGSRPSNLRERTFSCHFRIACEANKCCLCSKVFSIDLKDNDLFRPCCMRAAASGTEC